MISFDKTSVSMAAGSSGVLIGFGATILTLLMTSNSLKINPNAWNVTLGLLVCSIAFFSVAMEYYILSAWKAQTQNEYNRLALNGTWFYSLGMVGLVISIGTMFLALTSIPILPYLPEAVFLILWVVYFVQRTRGEPMLKERWVIRYITMIALLVGMVSILILSRG